MSEPLKGVFMPKWAGKEVSSYARVQISYEPMFHMSFWEYHYMF